MDIGADYIPCGVNINQDQGKEGTVKILLLECYFPDFQNSYMGLLIK